MQLDKIFRTVVQYKASDIYVTTGTKPVLRINGDLVLIEEHPVFTKKMAEEYLLEVMNEEQRKYFAKNLDLLIYHRRYFTSRRVSVQYSSIGWKARK